MENEKAKNTALQVRWTPADALVRIQEFKEERVGIADSRSAVVTSDLCNKIHQTVTQVTEETPQLLLHCNGKFCMIITVVT